MKNPISKRLKENLINAFKNKIHLRAKLDTSKLESLGSIDFLNTHINNSLLIYPYVTTNNHKSTTSKRDLIETNINKYLNAYEIELSRKNVLYRIAKGDTLVVNKVQEFDHRAQEVCNFFSEDFNSKTNINLYYSYKNTTGINVHFDHQDTIVIQTHGNKTWRLFDTTKGKTSLPAGRSLKPEGTEANNYKEITTQVGDILYIPKGMWHYAFTTNESSIHLALSLSPLKISDLVIFMLNSKLNELGEKDIYGISKNELIGAQKLIIESLESIDITEDDISDIQSEFFPKKIKIALL